MSFWEKTVNQNQPIQNLQPKQEVVLDEQAMAELQEDPNVDIFQEEDDDTADVMTDVNLRLEQGRLYQMVMQGDIFADTNADPKAIRNVQREIRKFVRERMETMVGIRQEQAAQAPIVSSPFNDMEVTVLKMLASKMSKGATEAPQYQQEAPTPVQPKKDGITSISGNLRPNAPAPLAPTKTAPKPAQKPKPAAKSALSKSEDESLLKKPIEEMTAEELAAHDAAALERRKKNYAATPTNLVPHPSQDQLNMMYTAQAARVTAPGSAVANIMALMGRN